MLYDKGNGIVKYWFMFLCIYCYVYLIVWFKYCGSW